MNWRCKCIFSIISPIFFAIVFASSVELYFCVLRFILFFLNVCFRFVYLKKISLLKGNLIKWEKYYQIPIQRPLFFPIFMIDIGLFSNLRKNDAIENDTEYLAKNRCEITIFYSTAISLKPDLAQNLIYNVT